MIHVAIFYFVGMIITLELTLAFLAVVFAGAEGKTDATHVLDASVYILGTAKGIKQYLPSLMGNAYIVASLFKSYTVIIYCNKVDVERLSEWVSVDKNVYTVLDEPSTGSRTSRLAAGRNSLLKETRTHMGKKNESMSSVFVAVMDMDNVNENMFNRTVLEQAMALDYQWDAVSFNRPHYYDIWALRYQKYDINVWGTSSPRGLVAIIQKDIKARLSVHTEQLFFPVYSAFNGFALYRMAAVGDCLYDSVDRDEVTGSRNGKDYWKNGDCEHVAFHKCMSNTNGARVVICKRMLHTETKWPDPPPTGVNTVMLTR